MNKDKMRKIFNYLLIIFLFEPNFFVKYPVLNIVFVSGSVFSFLIAVYKFFVEKNKITIPLALLVTWRIMLLIPTIINKGEILKWGYESMIFATLFLYAENFAQKKQFMDFVIILKNVFLSYLCINLITYVFIPQGLFDLKSHTKLFFLGVRTRFTEYAITCIMLGMICFFEKKIKPVNLTFILVICLLNIFLPKISTAIIGVGIMFLSYAFLKILVYKKKKNDFSLLLILSLIVTALVVFFDIQNMFSFFIEEVLGKNVTLTGRTIIWDGAIENIKRGNFIIGNGYVNDGNFIAYRNKIVQAHNQLLQLTYESGIIGALPFFCLMIFCLKSKNKETTKSDVIGAACIFSFLIMMITEIYAYYIAFFVALIVFCYRKNYDIEDKCSII